MIFKYACFCFNFHSVFKADKMNSNWIIKTAKCSAISVCFGANVVPWEAQIGELAQNVVTREAQTDVVWPKM